MPIATKRQAWRLLALMMLLQVALITGSWAQTSGVKEVKLPNGLTVLMKENHAAPVFTAQVWFKVGSRNEHVGITGISHMLEHMLFNSSENYKKGEITRMIREHGGIENAATWTDFTYYWQLLSSENLDLSLQTLAERVGKALLLPDEFAKERTVVLSEMQGDENDPGWLLYQGLWSTAFQAHPYHWPTIGWQSDVENIDANQLRNYYRTYYYPNNATLVLVGDLDSGKAMPLIKKYFGGIKPAKLPRPVYTTEPAQRGPREIVLHREGNAERIEMGYHIPKLVDPDTYPLMVLDQILSGGRSSRLYQAMVETQLSTSAWSSAGSRKDPALFMLGATARQGVHVDQLQKALIEQVQKAVTTLPTVDEMQAAKNQLEAYFVFQNDSVSDQGEQLGYYNTVADWRYLQTIVPKVKAVTPEQVQAVAKKYLTDDNVTIAKFVPTGPAMGGNGVGPVGPTHLSGDPNIELYAGKRGEGTGKREENGAAGSPQLNTQNSTLNTTKLVHPHREVLPNGITLIVQENHSNPTVAIAGNLKAGSCFDPEGKSGVADLVAEMVGRGTQKRTALQIARETDFVGASVDTSAGVESANFRASALKKDFALVVDILSDELRNASFPEDQFGRAKGQMLSGLEQSKESPDAQASRAFRSAIFPGGHPYHELTFDQAEQQLKAITSDDLVSFYKAYYRPDTTIIAITGDVTPAEASSLVKQYLGDWQAAGPKPVVNIPTIPTPAEGSKVVIPMMDKSEVSVIAGYPMGIRRSDPDYYAARIMNQIIGGAGALGSILGEDIREKNGLAYDVYSTFDATLGAGPWYAALGTNPKDADKAIQLLKTDVEQFRQKGATQQQFKQARDYIVGVFPIALETNSGLARMLLSAEFYGLGMDYLQNYAEIYRSVTLQQVNAAAKKYLHPESATLVIAGPYQGEK